MTDGAVCQPATGARRIVSAWETRQDGSGIADGIEFGIVCSDNTSVNDGTVFATANAAEWNAAEAMTWIGQPHLVSVGPTGWIALVGLVGQPGDIVATSHNVGIVLSMDGGDTWQVPHLVADLDSIPPRGGTDDGTPIVTDIAATAATWNNSFGTHDIFVVWQPNNQSPTTFFRTVHWDSAGVWQPPDPSTPMPQALIEPSIVAGTHNVIGNFVFTVSPSVHSPLPTNCIDGTFNGPSQTVQTWPTFWTTTPVGGSWFAGPKFTSTSWPQCVGGDHSGAPNPNTPWPNRARAPLAWDPIDNVVAWAVTRLRPGDASNSTQVLLLDSTWCQGCGGGNANGNFQGHVVSQTQRDPEVPSETPEEQFQPSIAIDNFGVLSINWLDTAESDLQDAGQNYVSSIHGQVQSLFTNPTPGTLAIFAPSPYYSFGHTVPDVGEYEGNAEINGGVFAVGFSDGFHANEFPAPLGGMYSVVAKP